MNTYFWVHPIWITYGLLMTKLFVDLLALGQPVAVMLLQRMTAFLHQLGQYIDRPCSKNMFQNKRV